MFCVRCKQAYRWNTGEMVAHNTNEEYHAWIQQIRQLTGTTRPTRLTDLDAEVIQRAYGERVTGEDGETSHGRFIGLQFMANRYTMETAVWILGMLRDMEMSFLRQAVHAIPSGDGYDQLRVGMILCHVSRQGYENQVHGLDRKSFLWKNVVFLTDRFLSRSTTAVRNGIRGWEEWRATGEGQTATVPQRNRRRCQFEADLLIETARHASELNRNLEGLWRFFVVPYRNTRQSSARMFSIFPNVADYIHAVDRYDPPSVVSYARRGFSDGQNVLRPTYARGGYMWTTDNSSAGSTASSGTNRVSHVPATTDRRRLERLFRHISFAEVSEEFGG